MALTDVQKDIIRGRQGVYQGTVNDLRAIGLWNKVTPLHLLNLQQTKKTWRTCRTCRGSGIVTGVFKGRELIYGKRGTEPVIQIPCIQCHGRKVVYG